MDNLLSLPREDLFSFVECSRQAFLGALARSLVVPVGVILEKYPSTKACKSYTLIGHERSYTARMLAVRPRRDSTIKIIDHFDKILNLNDIVCVQRRWPLAKQAGTGGKVSQHGKARQHRWKASQHRWKASQHRYKLSQHHWLALLAPTHAYKRLPGIVDNSLSSVSILADHESSKPCFA